MEDGLYCDGGWRWLSIGSEGHVYPCNAFMYNHDYTLGNLFTDDIILDKKFSRCPIQKCEQVCDRHWSKKQIIKDGEIVDEQDLVDPAMISEFKNPLNMLMAPTWKCNYSCKYCGLPSKEAYPDIPNACDVLTVDKWRTALGNFFDANNIDGGVWHTNGGEPLYYSGIAELFEFAVSRNFKVAVTTNLSYDVYSRIVSVVPVEAATVNCSLHPSDKNFDWAMFKGRLLLLSNLGYNVAVNFVGHPDQVMLAPEYKEFCDKYHITFVLIPFVGKIDGMHFESIESYPPAIKKVIYDITLPRLLDENRFDDGARVSD